jgi:hypothetical protein
VGIITAPLIVAGLSFFEQTLKYIHFKDSRKWSEKLVSLKNQYYAERRLPLDKQNDGKIERLEDEMESIINIATAEMRSLNELREKDNSPT